jgi:catechol 2,3-dioxygenase-like lactoylglutathione lyase family enzyme
MLGTAKLAGFIGTTNAGAARDFYENKLGLTFVSDEQYALLFDANGTRLRVQKVAAVPEIQYTALGWNVTDMDATVAALKANGVTFEHYPWMPDPDSDVMIFDGGAKVAWFKDPDGNILSLDQY